MEKSFEEKVSASISNLYDLRNRDAAEAKARRGEYLPLRDGLLDLIPNGVVLGNLVALNLDRMLKAPGSSHNHQAWEGGYIDHVTETMNIACQLYFTFEDLRGLPFLLSDALVVMFLHDLEKPWKHLSVADECLCGHPKADHNRINPWSDAACAKCSGLPRNCNMFRQLNLKTKEDRRAFRDGLIEEHGILLSDSQKNALRYVEGVPDSEYTPGERTMGELAAFCHCCDILSARLWYDWGKECSWTRPL